MDGRRSVGTRSPSHCDAVMIFFESCISQDYDYSVLRRRIRSRNGNQSMNVQVQKWRKGNRIQNPKRNIIS